MKVYVVEEYNTGKMDIFKNLEDANKFVQNYYANHIKEIYDGLNLTDANQRQVIVTDIENLSAAVAFIEDVMYIHSATYHE